MALTAKRPQAACYYVYELIDPRDGAVFYVGKGKGGRDRSHILAARRNDLGNPYKTARIQEIERAGFTVKIVRWREGLSERDALRLERQRIAHHGIENLTNITPGNQTAADRAAQMLAFVKPFDQWAAENNRGIDGRPIDPRWYDLIVAGLRIEAGLAG